jgi:hypothetical protein
MTSKLRHFHMKASGYASLGKSTHRTWIASEAMQHKNSRISGSDDGQWLSAWNRWCSHVETPCV